MGALGCPEGSTICSALVAVVEASGGSSVLNLLCSKDQANENWEHRSGIQQIFIAGYEGDSLARFSHCFSLLSFSSLSRDLRPTKTQDAQLQDLMKLRL